MKKKKKTNLTIVILFLTIISASAAFLIPYFHFQNNQKEQNKQTISFLKEKEETISDIEKKIVLSFNTPIEDENTSYKGALSWKKEYSDEYESPYWEKDKNEYDYVSFIINKDRNEVTINLLQPFGRTIIFTLTSLDQSLEGSYPLDYKRQLLSKGRASIKDNKLMDKGNILLEIVEPTYSLGSIGEREEMEISLELDFISSYTYPDWNSLFIDDKESEKSLNYLKKVLLSFNEKNFYYQEFQSCFIDETTCFSFFTNYNKCTLEGGGLRLILSIDREEVDSKVIQFDFNLSDIIKIDLEGEDFIF